jgi:hypothetical protein
MGSNLHNMNDIMSTVAWEVWAIPPIPNLTKRKEV